MFNSNLNFNKMTINVYIFSCAGSPFMYTVGSTASGGYHKVQAGGPGLEKGEVNGESKL